jgi:uncharacterized membrane protein YhaH (DUF805 family)
MNEYIAVLKKYAEFSGRARRREYWVFVLISMVICSILSLIDGVMGMSCGGNIGGATGMNFDWNCGGILSGIYSLAVLVPSIAVAVRRLHDTGRSAWWLLMLLIPIAGWIVLFVYMVQDSQAGSNAYGLNPKGA